MAKMIPPYWHEKTPNSEQRVFNLLQNDPDTEGWIVFHSLNLKQSGNGPYGEVDFVALIPRSGVLCIEVKGGRVACKDGAWTSTDASGAVHALKRSPFKQAQDGMHEVRKALEERLAGTSEFYKVPFGHLVIFTDVDAPPRDIGTEPWEVIDRGSLGTAISGHLLKAAKHQRARLRIQTSPPEPQAAIFKQMRDVLRPDFDRVISRGALLCDSERRLLRLTEEQYHILDLLGGNERCLFEGAAGTGKTLLALEFARRCARSGDKVLLVCFNRLLGDWFSNEVRLTSTGTNITSGRFYKCLRDAIVASPIATEFLDTEKQTGSSTLFDDVYPQYGQLALDSNQAKYDIVVVDEAQDLMHGPSLNLLDAWINGGLREGRWAFFGDFHRQAIYGTGHSVNAYEALASVCSSYARASLKQNCRNTRRIAEETALLSGFDSPPYRMGQIDGAPVDYLDYVDMESQRAALEKTLSKLAIERDLLPSDVVILSKYRLDQSVAGKLADNPHFSIRSVDQMPGKDTRKPTFIFATAQAFKGMESKVIVLCDVERIDCDEDRSLLYVAMSRARSLLTVFVHVRTKAAVREAFRKRLTEIWR
jgi:hypothetical protein